MHGQSGWLKIKFEFELIVLSSWLVVSFAFHCPTSIDYEITLFIMKNKCNTPLIVYIYDLDVFWTSHYIYPPSSIILHITLRTYFDHVHLFLTHSLPQFNLLHFLADWLLFFTAKWKHLTYFHLFHLLTGEHTEILHWRQCHLISGGLDYDFLILLNHQYYQHIVIYQQHECVRSTQE